LLMRKGLRKLTQLVRANACATLQHAIAELVMRGRAKLFAGRRMSGVFRSGTGRAPYWLNPAHEETESV